MVIVMMTKPFTILLGIWLLAGDPTSKPNQEPAAQATKPASSQAPKKTTTNPSTQQTVEAAQTIAKPQRDPATGPVQDNNGKPNQGAQAAPVPKACQEHQIQKDQIEEKIKKHRGFASFASWQLEEFDIKPCVHDGKVLAHLNLSAPSNWTPLNLPYRVWLTLAIKSDSGKFVLPARDAYNKLVQSIKAAALVLEGDMDIWRFVERYEIARVQIDKTDSADLYRISLVSDQSIGSRFPYVTYNQTMTPPIVAFGIERMDGLPARRELLRAIDHYSMKFPACRPVWYEVARVVDVHRLSWLVKIESRGKGCPAGFQVRMDLYGDEYNIVVNPSPHVESHASGGVIESPTLDLTRCTV